MAHPTFDSLDFGFNNSVTDNIHTHNRVTIGPIETAVTQFSFPGVDGEFQGNLGRRGRNITIDCETIAKSEASLFTLESGIEAYLHNGSYTLTAHGRAFDNTTLVGFEANGYREPLMYPYAFLKKFRLTFRCHTP